MSDLDLDAIESRNEKAHQEVVDLCAGKRRWTMTIPVDMGRDSDIVISDALNDVKGLLAEVRALRERVATLEGGVRLAHNVIESLAFCIEDPDGNPHLPPAEYESALERIEAWRSRRARALLDASHDQDDDTEAR